MKNSDDADSQLFMEFRCKFFLIEPKGTVIQALEILHRGITHIYRTIAFRLQLDFTLIFQE